MLSAATLESATARIRSPSGVKILDQAAKIALKICGKTNEMSQSNILMIQFTTHANQGQVVLKTIRWDSIALVWHGNRNASHTGTRSGPITVGGGNKNVEHEHMQIQCLTQGCAYYAVFVCAAVGRMQHESCQYREDLCRE